MTDSGRSGFVAIVGQPNVGKSTLLNQLLGVKLSITSRKPQTTRHRIIGINNLGDDQIVYVDTPGIHSGEKKAINRYMNRVAMASLNDVDAVVFMLDGLRFDEQDERVLALVKKVTCPVFLVINKVDKISDKEVLLPYLKKVASLHDFHAVIPLSAKNADMVRAFEQTVLPLLPIGHPFYSPDQLTDRSDRFVASEIVREKAMRFLGQEIPYSLTVTINAFEETKKLVKVAATIWVERDAHKQIVIGKNGSKLKDIGSEARFEMQRFFDKKIFLECWVKVKKGWSDNQDVLNQLGYGD